MASTNGKKITRKLTAILCADVVGYSRLMGEGARPLVYDGSMGKCRVVVVSGGRESKCPAIYLGNPAQQSDA